MAIKNKTNTKKKPITKKVAKSSKPKSKIDNGPKNFWKEFEVNLHSQVDEIEKATKTEQPYVVTNSPIDFNGYFKCPVKKYEINPTPWIIVQAKKAVRWYKDAADYTWNNPVKSFFIIAGIVFTAATASSIIHKYL